MNMIHIVIPVYNVEKYLEEAVRSVLDQPYKGIDIVLVDDGSPDNSPAICDRLAKECDRVAVIHKENGGVSSARNAGIEYFLEKYSDGYIAFLDADDYFLPNSVTNELYEMIESADAEVGVFAFGTCYCIEKNGNFVYSSGNRYSETRIAAGVDSIWNVNGHLGSMLCSLALLRRWNIRYPDDLRYCEDKIFMLKAIYLAEKICFVENKYLYLQRRLETSAMSKVKSIPPIDYYLPIINGWIHYSDFINQYENQTGNHCTAGYVLAGIYLMDMTADHFKRGGKRKEIFNVLKNHPRYDLFVNMRPQDVSKKQFKDHDLLLNSPRLFEIKYRFIGYIESIARAILQIPVVKAYIDKRRYPMMEMPVNKAEG